MSKSTTQLTGTATSCYGSQEEYALLRKDFDYQIGLSHAKAASKEHALSAVEKQRLIAKAYAGTDVESNTDGDTDPDGLLLSESTLTRYHDRSFMPLLGETYDSDDMEAPICPDADDIQRIRNMFQK